MMDTEFPLQLPLKIDWSDLDYFGHVNNISYFRYIQAARVNYMEHIGLVESYSTEKKGPIVASCKCDFIQPLFYPGDITIRSKINFIKKTSFGIYHQIMNAKGEVAAEAQDVMVMFDFNQNTKSPITAELRETIEQLENKKIGKKPE
ncbi:thioesterase family protein [Prolixibacter sp. NT017]|uniref:acyl-CoA thioesterase n=1 Tax=Prolixibacter sp. NT017 TaxID=2652390 RepID=UPI001289E400|nr:acyl-CoA thioesterase [Prolixibacter sp. NT017]GET24926.1 thioesterase [Prolixibacter sp. NT017]